LTIRAAPAHRGHSLRRMGGQSSRCRFRVLLTPMLSYQSHLDNQRGLMRVILKAAAILFVGFMGLRGVSSAQDEPVLSYATAFDLEQTVEYLTVRVLWAWADENGIEVAWLWLPNVSKPGLAWR